jgi:oxygen-independent coproporphyrinogen-3 oxidase
LNAYVHIPFCASHCAYCDFNSFAGRSELLPDYVSALCAEIEASSLREPLATVYFGGGTPSLLSHTQVATLLDAFRRKSGLETTPEISIEANPDSVEEGNLAVYLHAGVNRISLGAQAAQDNLLKDMGRRHDFSRTRQAVQTIRSAGFKNLNLDIMFGWPGQTSEMLMETLERFLEWNPEHLSLYALQVEAGTPFSIRVEKGLPVTSDEEQADQYAMAQNLLASAGMVQYEVSNFSKPGLECRHNLAVWRGEDYHGFGVSAVGTVGLERQAHADELDEYLRQAGAGQFPVEVETLTERVRRYERMMLGLRTREGVKEKDLFTAGADAAALGALLREGWFFREGDRIKPRPGAFFVLHGVLRRLFP